MKLGWLAAGVLAAGASAGLGAVLFSGCSGECDSAIDVCGSDGFLHSECDLPLGITAVPDTCCRFADGGVADFAGDGGTPVDFCGADLACRPNQPGTCIPPGSTLLPDGGILLADGGLFQAGGDAGF